MKLVKVNTNCNCSYIYAEIADIEVMPGEYVIVQTKQGAKVAQVKSPVFTPKQNEITNVQKILRKATQEDMEKNEELRHKEKGALAICLEKIAEHRLLMKLVSVEFLIDDTKAIFYFTADGRIDFRELVKDLAHSFHIRIEMRQIGVRDEAKMVGGIGNCGREFCCSTFLCSFEPVSVRMAKEQNLALNPMKISGACGRLMCCLAYEHETYVELKRNMPQCGARVMTAFGEGKIIRLDVFNNKAIVILATDEEKTFDISELEILKGGASSPNKQ